MKKYILIIVVIVIIGGIWFIINKNSNKTKESGVFKIGVSTPLTGPVAKLGEWSLDGMRLAVDKINKEGGIKGKKIELIVEDDKCDAKEGANTVQKLVNIDKVKNLVVYCGAVAGAVVNIIDGKALTHSLSVRTEALEGKYPFFFNLAPAPEKETSRIAQYMYDQGIRKVTVLYQSDFYGETYRNKFKKSFTALGGEVVNEGTVDNLSTPDFRTYILKAKEMKSQAVFTSFNAAQYSVILKQSKELGFDGKFFSVWNTENNILLNTAKELANGIIYTYSFNPSMVSGYDIFKKEYEEVYKSTPEFNAANGYDSIMFMASVIKECSDDIQCMITKTNALENIKSVTGFKRFVNNIVDKDIYLKTVKEEKFEFIK